MIKSIETGVPGIMLSKIRILILVSILVALVAVSVEFVPQFIEMHNAATAGNKPAEAYAAPQNSNPLRNMFGVNCYEWNFESNPNDPNDPLHVYPPKMDVIKNFTAIRHYLDWSKIENTRGNYTFNPANNGGWNYDAIYLACKQNNVLVLACLKTCPQWLVDTYPPGERDAENVPAPYGLSRSDPASYVLQAKAGFQFAARYGYNKNVDPTLVKVNTTPRWHGDPVNVVKIGLGLVKYIECDNERDKWWKGKKAQQNGFEYAANMSAFYDGNKGRLGKDVGIKNADPTMKVVMAGLATANPQFVDDMITWCKTNRGYKPDGSIDLCFDVINYHFSANDHAAHADGQGHRGIAPELSEGGKVADAFVAISHRLKQHPPVWITETCFDINPQSPQAAMAIGNKTTLETQGDWLLRTVLLFKRHGIKRSFYYQLYDDNTSAIQYSTSGLVDEKTLQRRPSADYVTQTNKLMGNYQYKATISQDPLVDVYALGDKKMYVLMIPDEKGRTGHYTLNFGDAKHVLIHELRIGANQMSAALESTINGRFDVPVTETPVFVEAQ